jgi:uncharacterized membrane protein
MKQRRLTLISPHRPVDIAAFALIMVLAVVLSIAGLNSDILTILSFITVFFVPGYMLQAVIFPEGRIWAGNQRVPDFFERIAISLVLSFIVIALTITLVTGGLRFVLLDLSKDMVMSIVLMVTALASIAAVDRRLTVPEERAFKVVLDIKPDSLNRTEKVLAVAVVLLVALAGINAVLQPANPFNPNGFTTFAIYGPDGTIRSLPNQMTVDNESSFTMFIECKENHAVLTKLTITLDNGSSANTRPIDIVGVNALQNGTDFSMNIELANGQKWTNDFRFSISAPGEHRLNLRLDIPGKDSRELWLWVSVSQ